MVSIAVGSSPYVDNANHWFPCAALVAISGVGAAFEYIYRELLPPVGVYYGRLPAVVTMSINSGQTGFAANGAPLTNHNKLLALVTPAVVAVAAPEGGSSGDAFYPGVFFAQSAGNNNGDSCSQTLRGGVASAAFKIANGATTTNASDGIVVVGAIKDDGTAATPFSASQPYLGFPGEAGSNYGGCIDIWAPGNMIYSTWGNGPSNNSPNLITATNSTLATVSYSGGQPSTYAPMDPPVPDWAANPGWMWLSGTSMAAPHVAAAAAYVIRKYGLETPGAVEAKLRGLWQYYGTSDALALPIYVVHLGP